MLITTLYFKQYSDYLLSTNDDLEVTWGLVELIILLGYESATGNGCQNTIFFFLHPSLSMRYRSAYSPCKLQCKGFLNLLLRTTAF